MPNLLIIGAGGIAHRQVENLRRIESLRIVGVCDLSAGRAEALAQKADAPAFADALESFRVAGEINHVLYGHTDELDVS